MRIRYAQPDRWRGDPHAAPSLPAAVQPAELVRDRPLVAAPQRADVQRRAASVDLEPLDDTFEIPRGFSIDRYLRNAWHLIPEPGPRPRGAGPLQPAGGAERGRGRVAQDAADRVPADDGTLDFHVTVSGLNEISWWILGYGDQAEVIRPPELRRLVAGHAVRMAAALPQRPRAGRRRQLIGERKRRTHLHLGRPAIYNASVVTSANPRQDAMFFSIDGGDGTGKSTQMERLCRWLRSLGHDVVTCRDPGSTPLGEAVRELLLDRHDLRIDRRSEMLLYMAARAQLVEEVIRPALAAGKTVVCDRYLLANVVYQGHAGGLDVPTLWEVGRVATGGVMPDLTIVLDMPADAAAARLDRALDRMEQQGDAFHARVRQGFLAEAAQRPDEIVVIDASRPIDEVQADIRRPRCKRRIEKRIANRGLPPSRLDSLQTPTPNLQSPTTCPGTVLKDTTTWWSSSAGRWGGGGWRAASCLSVRRASASGRSP